MKIFIYKSGAKRRKDRPQPQFFSLLLVFLGFTFLLTIFFPSPHGQASLSANQLGHKELAAKTIYKNLDNKTSINKPVNRGQQASLKASPEEVTPPSPASDASRLKLNSTARLSDELDKLRRRLTSLINHQRLRRTHFSIAIRWAQTEETIFEHQAHTPLVPASNMKLVTTIAAIHRLGVDFEYVTRVALSSNSLLIIGSGDPLLGDKEIDKRTGRKPYWLLEDLTARLQARGISALEDIILDTSIFGPERVHPQWPPNARLQKYACEVSGLNYNNNCVEISVANRQGKTVLFLEPKTAYLRLINATTAVSSKENWFSVERTTSPRVLRVTGKINTQAGPYAVAIENPALFLGTLIKEQLAKKGIIVTGEVREESLPADQNYELVAEYRTPLLEVLRRANKDSLGLAAEALIKTLGAWENPEHKGGTWEAGRNAVARFLTTELGIPEEEFMIADGSGLSRENRLTANALSSLLSWVHRQPFWPEFETTMAVGGVDGTLENVFRERALRGRVVAKTGYINGVRALSGITHTRQGDIIFSFLANNASNLARSTINNIVKEITYWADTLNLSPSLSN